MGESGSESFVAVMQASDLRNGDHELEQFAMNSWRTPERVGVAYLPNQITISRSTDGRPDRECQRKNRRKL